MTWWDQWWLQTSSAIAAGLFLIFCAAVPRLRRWIVGRGRRAVAWWKHSGLVVTSQRRYRKSAERAREDGHTTGWAEGHDSGLAAGQRLERDRAYHEEVGRAAARKADRRAELEGWGKYSKTAADDE